MQSIMALVHFAERLPWLVAVRGRRTRGQCTALEAIGFALGVPPRDAVLEIVWPARHTALGGPLDGTRRFGWGRASDPSGGDEADAIPPAWDGLSGGTSSE
jgi:hypothetical protein